MRKKTVNNIVLIGMMGSGKSTIGTMIAEELGYKFIDTDDLIETKAKKAIPKIFEAHGESYFRELECKAVSEVSHETKAVISTGGGVVLNKENIQNLKKNGLVILLNGDADTLYKRLHNNSEDRPLLNDDDLKMKITDILEKRKDLYFSSCDKVVEIASKDPKSIVSEIIEYYCNIK